MHEGNEVSLLCYFFFFFDANMLEKSVLNFHTDLMPRYFIKVEKYE